MRQKADRQGNLLVCLSFRPFSTVEPSFKPNISFILQNCDRKELHILDIFQTGGTELCTKLLSSDIIPKQKLWLRNWRRKLTNWQTAGCGSFPSLSPTAERASSLQRIQVAAMDKIRMLKILIFADMIIGALGLAGYFIGGILGFSLYSLWKSKSEH